LKVWSSAFARRRSRDALLSQEDRPDLDGGVVRVRERDVDLRRVAVKYLSISEEKRDEVSLEESSWLARAEHRIDSSTCLIIIGEVGNHVDDELILVEAGRGAPRARPG
jgi:membrane protein implicated in regulation of membrane protease activity